MISYDVIILGGGAAGMAAAIACGEAAPEAKVLLLEKKDRLGKKLLATGNGRCNIGNALAAPGHYHSVAGDAASFVQPALRAFPPASNRQFFQSVGVVYRQEEEGKEYPYSNQASAVLDCLRQRLAALSVQVQCGVAVERILPQKRGGFLLQSPAGQFTCQNLLLTLGGVASPQLSHSQGFEGLVRPLGHTVSPLFPALVQVKTANQLPKALKGTKLPAEIRLYQQEQEIAAAAGELLFTEYGISGPPVFQISRWASANAALKQPSPQMVAMDFIPDFYLPRVEQLLRERQQTLGGSLEQFLTGWLPKRLGQQLLKQLGYGPLSRPASALTQPQLAALAKAMKGLQLPVTGVTGWQHAQVMAGGFNLAEFDPCTLASRLQPGLYAAGEVLDIDGDCGGYNLTWAWSSARLAARSILGGQ